MSRNLRHYARQTQSRLILGLVLLVAVVGDGLIYIFFGARAALFGLICVAAALGPILLIVVIFAIFDWLVRRSKEDQ